MFLVFPTQQQIPIIKFEPTLKPIDCEESRIIMWAEQKPFRVVLRRPKFSLSSKLALLPCTGADMNYRLCQNYSERNNTSLFYETLDFTGSKEGKRWIF